MCFSCSFPSTCFWPLPLCYVVRRTSAATHQATLTLGRGTTVTWGPELTSQPSTQSQGQARAAHVAVGVAVACVCWRKTKQEHL